MKGTERVCEKCENNAHGAGERTSSASSKQRRSKVAMNRGNDKSDTDKSTDCVHRADQTCDENPRCRAV